MATSCRIPIQPDRFTLSVVIPVYNELDTVEEIVARVRATPYRKEIVVVDDFSTDGTRDKLTELRERGWIDQIVLHDRNRGKGAALASGFQKVTGDLTIVQDADLEYDPNEYPKLLQPFFEGKADVVYGSRFLTGSAHRVLFFWHSIANRMLTLVSNMFTNLNLTDMETCYKVFRTEVVQAIDIREQRFGVEPEITAKMARMGCRIYEVGISYDGGSYQEGKKIGWRDAVTALTCVVRYGLFHRAARRVDEVIADARRRRESTGGNSGSRSDTEAGTPSTDAAGHPKSQVRDPSPAPSGGSDQGPDNDSERDSEKAALEMA